MTPPPDCIDRKAIGVPLTDKSGGGVKILRFLISWTLVWFLALSSAAAAPAPDQERTILNAQRVLEEIMGTPDKAIPRDLLARCKAIVIYPTVIKGGFIFGGRYGKGVVLRRDKKSGKFGPVAFVTMTGASFGLQAGIQGTDLILLIMNNDGIEGLLSTRLTLGGDMAISAGPIGRNAEIATDLSLRAGILSYSQSRGFYGGIALNGALIIPDGKANAAYYGAPISSKDILLDSRAPILPASQRLIDALNRYSSGG